jgi:hypothetical protein
VGSGKQRSTPGALDCQAQAGNDGVMP